MKKILFRTTLLLALMFANLTASAQQPVKVEDTVKQIVEEYDKVKGVECLTMDGGIGLGMMKSMFKQKFGKEFMKDVTLIVLINYSNASNETAAALRKRLESFSTVLKEFKLDDSQNKDSYMRCFATLNGQKSLSDFMVLVEEGDSRMYIYMGGNLSIEKLDLQL